MLCCSTWNASAQKIPNGIPFQGIAKDYTGAPANERKVFIQTNLIAGSITGKSVYTEVHETTTDGLGVFSIMIGQGHKTDGIFQSLTEIAWEDGPYFLGIQLAIMPYAPVQNWQYQNNWINMGTTSLGIVPYAFYAVQTSGLQSKLNASDTAQMLRNYVKNQVIKLLDSAIGSKLSAKDTIAMLAPYIKAAGKDTTEIVTTNPAKTTNSFSGEYNDLTGKPTLFSGIYNDLTEKPNLFNWEYDSLRNKPVLFDLEYDSLKNKPSLFSGAYNNLTGKPNLFSGSYLDLSDKPVLFNWEYDSLKNKPSLFSGAYHNLTGKPILFSGDYLDLTSKPNLFSGSYLDLSNKPVLFDGDYNALGNRPVLFNGDYNALSNIPSLSLIGDITSVGNATSLSISGVASGTYGSALAIPTITVDAKGRITAASSTNITPNNFPNKTNAEKNVMPVATATGTVIWCSDCGTRGQLQVYNGTEWTDMTGGTAAASGIVFSNLSLSAISSNSANAYAGVTGDGGSTITAKGVVWSTSVNPTIALTTKTNDGTGIGAFTSSISSLSTSTLYYVRAYATNANGTVYGTQQSFTTLGALPTLTTTSITGISLTGANSGGNISSDGGTTITRRGICWSTSSNPTINDNKLVNGNGSGSFTSNLIGLDGGTTYYVRAYATNGVGTGYGSQIIFNTSAMVPGVAYMGGKVAYIFQSGDAGYVAGQIHGFIIMSHAMGIQVPFSNSANNSYNSTSMNFGTGRNNTSSLYSLSTTVQNAAKYIYNVQYDGYNDWYIPSYSEWNKIALGWSSLGLADGIYHSSSAVSSSYYFAMAFYNSGTGYQSTQESNTSLRGVIGIRNF